MPIISPSAVGGGGAQLLDLGVYSPTQSIDGPKDLLDGVAGQYIQLTFGTTGYVALDTSVIIAFAADFSADLYFGTLNPSTALHQLQGAFLQGWVVRNTAPVNVYLSTATNGYYVSTALPAWVALHTYAAAPVSSAFIDNTCGITASGHFWSSSGWTSGALIPDFPSNFGGTVLDGTVTWTDEGALPAVGAIHLYAFVQTPS